MLLISAFIMWRSGDCRKLAGDHTRCGGFDRKLLYWRKLNYHSCVDRQIIAPDNVTVTERRERPRHEEQLKKNPKTFNQTQQLRHISVYSLCRSLPLSLSQAFCSIDLSRKRKDEPCFGSHLEHLKNHLAHHSLQPESIRAAAEDLLLQPSRHHIMEAAWVPKHRGPQ